MDISVIVPVYNEEDNLKPLYARLVKALDSTAKSYEIIFINDGSKDSSFEILRGFAAENPKVKVIDFVRNFGQHPAIIAGFANASGELVITIDADLQNPPEEISRIAAEFDKGYDVIGTIRQNRNDTLFRRYASKLVNKIRKIVTKIPITDQGCMMRGYSKEVVAHVAAKATKSTFIPILAHKEAKNPTEIPIAHAARNAGESKYTVFTLAKLALNLFKKEPQAAQSQEKHNYEIWEKIGF